MRTVNKKIQLINWLKRFGFWGFVFFLIKGLLWLLVGYQLFK